jgi:hypothetical protein
VSEQASDREQGAGPSSGRGSGVPGLQDEAAQAPATGGTGTSAAGVPSGAAPSRAVSAGHVPEDAVDERIPTDRGPQAGGDGARAVPGQPPGEAVPPVPAPGDAPGVALPGVQAGQGASPEDGVHAGDKGDDSDASVASAGAWTALAPPGKPDGEVDTRSR